MFIESSEDKYKYIKVQVKVEVRKIDGSIIFVWNYVNQVYLLNFRYYLFRNFSCKVIGKYSELQI